MKILIVHDSRFGNGKSIANAIADGIKARSVQADVAHVSELDGMDLGSYKGLVLGWPVHIGGATSASKKATEKLGLRCADRMFTTFSTSLSISGGIRSQVKMISKAKDCGLRYAMDGAAFRVKGFKGPLYDGELERALEFGRSVGEKFKALGSQEQGSGIFVEVEKQ